MWTGSLDLVGAALDDEGTPFCRRASPLGHSQHILVLEQASHCIDAGSSAASCYAVCEAPGCVALRPWRLAEPLGPPRRLDGSMSAAQRSEELDRFRSAPDVLVMLFSLMAGSTGLNLTVRGRGKVCCAAV